MTSDGRKLLAWFDVRDAWKDLWAPPDTMQDLVFRILRGGNDARVDFHHESATECVLDDVARNIVEAFVKSGWRPPAGLPPFRAVGTQATSAGSTALDARASSSVAAGGGRIGGCNLNLDLLFKREEAASGLLAAALHELPGARDAFFSLLEGSVSPKTITELSSAEWSVEPEVDGYDVRLRSTDPPWVIVIENKLQSASVRSGQLQTYYDKLFDGRPKPDQQVGVILLAPGDDIGAKEVREVTPVPRSAGRRDFVARVSWEVLAESLCTPGLRGCDPNGHWFLTAAMDAVRATIERLQKKRSKAAYPNVGTRKRYYDVAAQVVKDLEAGLSVGGIDRPWPKRDGFILSTRHTRITLWVCLEFAAMEEPPYEPTDADGPVLKMTFHAKMKPAGKFAGHPEVNPAWNALAGSGSFDVEGVGRLSRKSDGWFHFETALNGDEKALVTQCTDLGAKLLRVVEKFGPAK